MSEHDAVTPLPGAPAADEGPVTVTAPWHNAPGTGAVAEAPAAEVRAFDKGPEGVLVAKVIEPPARAVRKAGPKAEAKAAKQAASEDS